MARREWAPSAEQKLLLQTVEERVEGLLARVIIRNLREAWGWLWHWQVAYEDLEKSFKAQAKILEQYNQEIQ